MDKSPSSSLTNPRSESTLGSMTSSPSVPAASTLLPPNPSEPVAKFNSRSLSDDNRFQNPHSTIQGDGQCSYSSQNLYDANDESIIDVESLINTVLPLFPISSPDPSDNFAVPSPNISNNKGMASDRSINTTVSSLQKRNLPYLELGCDTLPATTGLESIQTYDINKNYPLVHEKNFLGPDIECKQPSDNKEENNNEESKEDREKRETLLKHVNPEIRALLDYNYCCRSDEENLACFVCCEAFNERVHLKNHIVNLHLRHIPISQFALCPYCAFACKSRYQFVEHVLKSRSACRSLMMRNKSKRAPKQRMRTSKQSKCD
ncbi:uncharacterized protein LOC133178336 [Saccostrea echinata]|uniref:uncharacterized protein LOC133178336 n=1 Tax=Saccostrea echinata TaxID=191078 RepID=UPI002A7FFD3E|nr:uncharacterized protein LOC133178336 [Saccostrea echinata]